MEEKGMTGNWKNIAVTMAAIGLALCTIKTLGSDGAEIADSRPADGIAPKEYAEQLRREAGRLYVPRPEDAELDTEYFEKVAMPFYVERIVDTYRPAEGVKP
ncbi:MAG: hypothetical protein K6G91_01865 [Kiritimatiellae bacterium]|nr:hypothetical protein [Kiritimatiellia bacterium]